MSHRSLVSLQTGRVRQGLGGAGARGVTKAVTHAAPKAGAAADAEAADGGGKAPERRRTTARDAGDGSGRRGAEGREQSCRRQGCAYRLEAPILRAAHGPFQGVWKVNVIIQVRAGTVSSHRLCAGPDAHTSAGKAAATSAVAPNCWWALDPLRPTSGSVAEC